MIRLAKDFVPLVEQHEAHAPRVRTDGDDLFAELFSGEREAILDFCPEPQHVPTDRFAERNRVLCKNSFTSGRHPFCIVVI